jgi:uncharacterized membrane protein YdfJ with MMPL/SSD domain
MRRGLIALVGIIVALVVVAQFVLPGLAAKRLRSDLAKQGSDVHVEVSAFPAIKLLFNHADKVTVSVGSYKTDDASSDDSDDSGDDLPDLLAQTKATKKLDVDVRVLNDSLLRMQDVRLHKDGNALTANVTLLQSDIDTALPAQLKLTGSDADGLTVSGSTDAFGEGFDAEARVEADDDGSLVLRPDTEGIDLGDLISISIFDDKRVAVDSISARSASDRYDITIHGHLR